MYFISYCQPQSFERRKWYNWNTIKSAFEDFSQCHDLHTAFRIWRIVRWLFQSWAAGADNWNERVAFTARGISLSSAYQTSLWTVNVRAIGRWNFLDCSFVSTFSSAIRDITISDFLPVLRRYLSSVRFLKLRTFLVSNFRRNWFRQFCYFFIIWFKTMIYEVVFWISL